MAEREIKFTIIGDATKAQKAFNDAGTSATTLEGKVTGLSGKFANMASVAGGALLAGGVAKLGSALLDGAKGAAQDELAMDKLRQAIENTGKSADGYQKTIDEQIKKGQELAFTDGETMEALANLTAMTGDADEAMKRLGLAQDLARGAGISLEQASKLLGKTSDENTAALGRLGIKLGENATAQDVLNAVDAKYGGQAGVYAESAAGQMAIASQQAGELAETFGAMLIPVITLLTGILIQLVGFISTNVVPAVQTIMDAFVPVGEFIQANLVPILAGLGAALMTLAVAAIPAMIAAATTFVTTTAPALIAQGIAIAVAYAPLTLAVLGIAAAVAGLAYAWEHNLGDIQGKTEAFVGWITPYWQATWGAIQAVIDTVWPIIKTVVTTYIAALRLEIETAVNAVRTIWDAVFPYIQSVVETVFPIIAAAVTTYIGILRTEIETGVAAAKWAFDNVFVPIQGVVSDVFTTISGLVTTLWGPAVTAIELGVAAAKTAFDVTFVPIQGVVEDVFNTIVGTIESLWSGATGGVAMIANGVANVKAAFFGIYDDMHGFGANMMQGLIDGISSLWETLKGWWDKVAGIADKAISYYNKIHSPSLLMYERGQQLMEGLTLGIIDGIPQAAAAAVSAGQVVDSALHDSLFQHPGQNYGSGGGAPGASSSGGLGVVGGAPGQSGGLGSGSGLFQHPSQDYSNSGLFQHPSQNYGNGGAPGQGSGGLGSIEEAVARGAERGSAKGIAAGFGSAPVPIG